MLRNSFRDLHVRLLSNPGRNNGIFQWFCMLNNKRISKYSSRGREKSPHRKNARGRAVVQKSAKSKHIPNLVTATSGNQITHSESEQLFKPVFPDPVKKSDDVQDVGEEIAGKLTGGEKAKVLRTFIMDNSTQMLASQHGIEGNIFEIALQSFRKYCVDSSQLPVELHIVFRDLVRNVGHVSDLFPFFLSHSKTVFPHLDCMADLKKISDLTDPSQWYPLARTIQRKIIYHAGPTNSGKTYHALKRFMESDSGVYCGPLRLLAMEVFDKCNNADVPCDLITGETRRFANDDETPAEHVACTVEMANLNQEYEVAVIDEIQMIGDIQRGWSWTRTLLGIAAKEVHVCGEETAIDLVQNLMDTTGDSFEIRRYERLTSLTYQEKAVGNFDQVKNGDCIVCFSKKDIFKVFNVLTAKGHKCAVIYGDLPPGTKIMQSRKFNDPKDPCGVLVATDAVGMGLNLAIKRVIFYSLIKRTLREDHTFSMDYLSTSQAQQIGGRAGRFRTQYEDGEVTTFWQKDLTHLHRIVNVEKSPLEKAGMNPTAEMIEMFSYHLPRASLSNLIDIFVHVCKLDDLFFMCNLMQFKELAELIEHIPLPLKTRYTLCSSPLKVRKGFAQVMFVKIAMQMSNGFPLTYGWLCQILGAPFSIPRSVSELEQLEGAFDVVDIYLWLSYRYPDLFVDADEVRQLRVKLDAIIQAFLNRGRIAEKKRRKGDLSHVFGEQSAAENNLEDLEPDLIQNNPLQAYTPKPKPKAESEKHKVLTDVYKELEDIERGIVEPEDKAVISFFSNKGDDKQMESMNVKDIAEKVTKEENDIEDDIEDMEKNSDNIVLKDTATVIDKENQSEFMKQEGFLSRNNEMYNEIAGSYKLETMFQQKKTANLDNVVDAKVEGKYDEHGNHTDDPDVTEKQVTTKFGMDEEEVNQFKDMLTSAKQMKIKTQTFGMGEGELNQFKDLLTSMKKKTKRKGKKPKDKDTVDKFVHVYPRKQIKRLTDDFQISEYEGVHESDKVRSFSERLALLSSIERSQLEQSEQFALNKNDTETEMDVNLKPKFNEQSDLERLDNFGVSSTECSSLAPNGVSEFGKQSSSKLTSDATSLEKEHKDGLTESEVIDQAPSYCTEGLKNHLEQGLNGRANIDTAKGEESLEEKLVKQGVLTEEMLEKLKAEWEKKHDKGQKNENNKNRTSIDR